MMSSPWWHVGDIESPSTRNSDGFDDSKPRFGTSTALLHTDDAGFADKLTNHELNIAWQLVADIAVGACESVNGANRRVIEALVLED
jgi:hypothetical protein